MTGLRSVIFAQSCSAVLLAVTPAALAQNVVSAVAGYIHFAKDGVLLDDEPFEFHAAEFIHVSDGERLRTTDGWAEVMIIPGSFIRLAPNTEMEMIRAGLLRAHMRLIEGSAVIDLTRATKTGGITIEVGEARVSFAKSGSFRFDVPVAGDPTIRAIGGRAWVDWRGERLKLSGGRELVIAGSNGRMQAEKFDKSDRDALDRWNAKRRRMLAVTPNQKMGRRDDGLRSLEESDIYRCRAMGSRCPPQFVPQQSPTAWPTNGRFAQLPGVR